MSKSASSPRGIEEEELSIPILRDLVREAVNGKVKFRNPSHPVEFNRVNAPTYVVNVDNHFDYVSKVLNTDVGIMRPGEIGYLKGDTGQYSTFEEYIDYLSGGDPGFEGMAERFEAASEAMEAVKDSRNGPYINTDRFETGAEAYEFIEGIVADLKKVEKRYTRS